MGRAVTAGAVGRIAAAAADGFSAGAASYERGRPSYPADAVARLVAGLGIGSGSRVVDLAAGTGKLTRLLTPTVAAVIAVEPVAEMRAHLAATAPGVEVLDGTAEGLPLPTASVDAVLVAQAFHWFRIEPALAEIARVLRPGGGLGIIFNERDTSEPWVAELSKLIRWDERARWQVPYTVETDWAERIGAVDTPFGPVERFDTTHRQRLDTDTLVDRVLSTSYIAASADAERARIEAAVRALAADFDEPFDLPYVTVALWCHRLPSAKLRT